MTFLKLIRWQNLVIIIFIHYFVRYFLIDPFYRINHIILQINNLDFAIIVLTNILIAGAGYIINDIFDLQIDRINKPDKIVIGEKISEQKAYLIYYIMNSIAVMTGIYTGIKINFFNFGLIFAVFIAVFYFYSLKYKRLFLWGNIVISLMSGILILLIWMLEFLKIQKNGIAFAEGLHAYNTITYFAVIYAVFSFLTTFLREIIKDIEDIEGDSKWGCTTLPIVVGIKNAKKIATLFSILILFLVVFFQIKLFNYGINKYAAMLILIIQLPLVYLTFKIWKAKEKADFHYISILSKIIMVFGILSMLGVYFSLQS